MGGDQLQPGTPEAAAAGIGEPLTHPVASPELSEGTRAAPLPREEQWSEVTWAYLRRSALRHLRRCQPCTISGFAADPPKPLDLALNESEAWALLDSAHRLRQIEMISDGRRLDGTPIEPEWALTPQGLREARRASGWATGSALYIGRHLPAALAWIAGLLTLFGITISISHLTPKLAEVQHTISGTRFDSWSSLIFSALFLACLLAWFRQSGLVHRGRVAAEWSRYAELHPQWRERPLGRFPWFSATIGGIVYLTADGSCTRRERGWFSCPACR